MVLIDAAIAVSTWSDFSVLFPEGRRVSVNQEMGEEPEYFGDLNLDQVVDSITVGSGEYDLAPFFYEHLDDSDTIRYRQEAFADLEKMDVFEVVSSFAEQMRETRAHLVQVQELSYRYQKESWFIDAVDIYRQAVASLADALCHIEVGSRALLEFREHLAAYLESRIFQGVCAGIEDVRAGLAEVEYSIRIKGQRVTVSRYDGAPDYGAEVLATFERFKQGSARDYRFGFRNPPGLNHIEAQILSLVARLFPGEFANLDMFFEQHQAFIDPMIARFDREVHFYLAYLAFLRPLRSTGLRFCYPEVTRRHNEVFAKEAFDLALATKLVEQGSAIVGNDFNVSGLERILVVSGANQGGKTTFARMFGQLHHLAGIGCPVPGRSARLYIFDQLFTHFGHGEDLENMTGRLEDDLLRMKGIIAAATRDSIIVVNEVFASTTLSDAQFLGEKVLEQLIGLGLLAVVVTFVEELASLGPQTVSMVSTVAPDNPLERTFKVVRQPADGLAHALAIAEKYGLTYEALKRRIAR